MKKIVFFIGLIFVSKVSISQELDSLYYNLNKFLIIRGIFDNKEMNNSDFEELFIIKELVDTIKNPANDKGIYLFEHTLGSGMNMNIFIKDDTVKLFDVTNLNYLLTQSIIFLNKKNNNYSESVKLSYIEKILEIHSYYYYENIGNVNAVIENGRFIYNINLSNLNIP